MTLAIAILQSWFPFLTTTFVAAVRFSLNLGLVLGLGWLQHANRRAFEARLEEDTRRATALAHRTLRETPGVQHLALHVREEIAGILCQDDPRSRPAFGASIWPAVVAGVEQDARIRKVRPTSDRHGDVRDLTIWQWTKPPAFDRSIPAPSSLAATANRSEAEELLPSQ